MNQGDNRILKELQSLSAAAGGSGGGGGGGGGALGGITLAIEEQTDGTNWKGMILAGNAFPADGHPNKIITQRFTPDRIASGTALAANTARMVAFYVAKQRAITGLKWYQAVAGAGFTPNNSNQVGLYSYIPGQASVNIVAASNDNAALWSTAVLNTYGNANFAAPYQAPPGIYFGAFLYNGTGGTGPSLGSHSILNPNSVGGTNTLWTDPLFNLVSTVGSQNSLAASYALSAMTQASASGYNTWAALY